MTERKSTSNAKPEPASGGDQIFVAKQSFSTDIDGQAVTVHGGITRVREGHPLLAGREELFEPLTVHFDTERAPGRSGETRG